MSGTITRYLLAVGLLLLTAPAHGSGFGIFTQGGAALGEADAVVAHGERPSAIFFNPALIAGIDGTRGEIGTTLILPRRSFSGVDGSSTATREAFFTPSTIYLTHRLGRGVTAGLGVFNPFGLGTDWGETWSGRYLVTDAELSSYAVNPVLAFRPHRAVSVAAGLEILIAETTLEGRVPAALAGTPVDVGKRFSGSGTGVGYNLGVLVELGKGVSVGASYRSAVPVTLSGELSVGGVKVGDGESRITFPQQLFAGIAFRPSDRLTLESGVRYEGWSSLQEVRVDRPGLPSLGPETAGSADPRQWHDTWGVNLGGRYQLSEALSLAAGYLYGFSAVPDRTFEPAVPDADTHLFCIGAGMQWDRLQLDLGYGYQMQKSRTKTTNLYGAVADGRYDAELHLIGVSLGCRF